MQLMEVPSKYSDEIKQIQQAMQAQAQLICERDPVWNRLRGKLDILVREHQKEIQDKIEPPFEKEVTE